MYVYDASGSSQPLLNLAAPSGGTCGPKPCWSAVGGCFKYKDKLLTPNGLAGIGLKEGLVDGKAKMKLKGKGANLSLPGLPLTPPVTVQVKHTDTGLCWEAVFTTPKLNDAKSFKASSD